MPSGGVTYFKCSVVTCVFKAVMAKTAGGIFSEVLRQCNA
ncbi:hypothetical protein HMPREF0281_01359 [Corynebacterium ammoniagenes DSM 20306]|uniref:Uncharacterized protein n=1 Tax=Corynebacterium ammoniagenes DSM 20306 TaxID=649754 RepID=A0ABP2IK03_CORAM|nr:hypothetical protein HMPREF0281_01359 [Corynebacterium ammoniagenes DSM 20306]